jgi:hypothetical protein
MIYLLPDKVYDAIKYIATIVIPALSVAYVGFAGVWGWPYADEVARTLAIVETFLCSIMGISALTAVKDPDATCVLPKHSKGGA